MHIDHVPFDSLTLGDMLCDTHVMHPNGIGGLIQERIVEPIEVTDIITIEGGHADWFDLLLHEQMDAPTVTHVPHRYTNKMVVVLGDLYHDNRGLLIGWSWDHQWIKFAKLKLKR